MTTKTPRASRDQCLPSIAEAFREHGYDGASVSVLAAATGLTNGSLYHFFPGGKPEMLAAVLADIDGWFVTHLFDPLRAVPTDDPAAAHEALADMVATLDAYFRSGRRVCLPGAVALSDQQDRYAAAVAGYFTGWITALTHTLTVARVVDPALQAHVVVAVAQGAIVLAHAQDDPTRFAAALRAVLPTPPTSAKEPSTA